MSKTDESENLDLSSTNIASDGTPQSDFPTVSILVTAIAAIICAVSGYVWFSTGGHAAAVVCVFSQTVLVSIVIWQACDPFADAAQYIGHVLKLPGSVRGATLDAIASSMPELFTGIFFVVVALAFGSEALNQSELAIASGEGFSLVIATCAGSAVYNMILIPAICAIFISYYRPSRPTIDVEHRVITRDGAWFVGMELLLIVFLFMQKIEWWMGVVFLCSYAAYVVVLYFDARYFQRQMGQIEQLIGEGMSSESAIEKLESEGSVISRDLAKRFKPGQQTCIDDEQDDDSDEPDAAGVCFGLFEFRLTMVSAWVIICVSTVVAASACYWLVTITESTAELLDVPKFFVAVILAAAASSVPDTFLSIGSAKKGDDDGAVSNAFGSNIFDISICISIPLLVASYLNGWQPIVFAETGSIVSLQAMLAGLTVITLGTIWHKLQLTRKKAYFLVSMYLLFICYAVAGSLGWFG